jgi:hypothetical protein
VGDPFLPNLPTSGDVLEHMKKKMREAGLLA